jgi:hypothetical protein
MLFGEQLVDPAVGGLKAAQININMKDPFAGSIYPEMTPS